VTDAPLIAKKLAFLEACVRDARAARLDDLDHDVREERYLEHTLQLAIQAALDVASHIVSDQRLGEPATNRELFALLARDGWVAAAAVPALQAMAGFRNILVHGYTDVDRELVKDVVRNHLGDLLAYADAIRDRLARG